MSNRANRSPLLSPEAAEARRRYRREWNRRNPEKLRQYNRQFWEKKAEQFRQQKEEENNA
ncbi:MAG: phosphatase [Clostridia bacterium]|nr:phosphatase [Clostridia bacterium]